VCGCLLKVTLTVRPRGEVAGPSALGPHRVREHVIGLCAELNLFIVKDGQIFAGGRILEVEMEAQVLVHILDHRIEVVEVPLRLLVSEVVAEQYEEVARLVVAGSLLQFFGEGEHMFGVVAPLLWLLVELEVER